MDKDAYSTRDLALLLLAQGRVARRLRGAARQQNKVLA